MKSKEQLKTVRLTGKELGCVDAYLEQNPAIGNFSSLVRIALLDFISKRGSIPLNPIVREERRAKPSFLWDYDLSDGEIREIISGPANKRRWLVAKILTHAKFDEVWNYLTLEQIEQDLPYLRMPKKNKESWEYATARWRKKRWRS